MNDFKDCVRKINNEVLKSNNSNKISIAKVLKPQGLKGELKCSALIENVDLFSRIKKIYCENKEYKVISGIYRLGFVYICLENINNIEIAEKFRNKIFYIDKNDFGVLEKDSYFIDDLINLKLFDEKNQYIGDILDVENYGATDILIVKEKDSCFSVPFLNKIFPKIDIQNGSGCVIRQEYESNKVRP